MLLGTLKYFFRPPVKHTFLCSKLSLKLSGVELKLSGGDSATASLKPLLSLTPQAFRTWRATLAR